MNNKKSLVTKRILFVEGKDECGFFKGLLKNLTIESILWEEYENNKQKDLSYEVNPDAVQIIDVGGKDKFSGNFEALSINDFNSRNCIGIVRDAEQNPAESAFSSICSILKKFNLPVPANPKEIKNENSLKIGIYIMPDNLGEGMLENLCLESIKSQPINQCIDNYIQCFKVHQSDEENKKYKDQKARVQTYLASRSPIVRSLGEGAQSGFLDFNHNCFDDIKKFVNDLFL